MRTTNTAQAVDRGELRRHPKLASAYDALKDAKEEMVTSKHDYKGHREEAVKSIEHAMHQIAICMEIADR